MNTFTVLARPEDFDNSLLLCVTPAVPSFPVKLHPTKDLNPPPRTLTVEILGKPAFRVVHGPNRQVFETTLLLTRSAAPHYWYFRGVCAVLFCTTRPSALFCILVRNSWAQK